MRIKFYAEFLPLPLIVLGILLFIYAILAFINNENYLTNSIVMLVGAILTSTHQGVTIDTKEMFVSDYYWLLGLKLNNYRQSYEQINTIVLSQTNYTQGYGLVPRINTSGLLYQGYLKIKDRDSIYLGRSKNKSSLQKKLNSIAVDLGISVTDTTEKQ